MDGVRDDAGSAEEGGWIGTEVDEFDQRWLI